MPIDAPDYTTWVQTVEVIASSPTPLLASTETPISETEGKVTTTSSDYQTLATWTISAGKIGVLYGVELYAVPFSAAHFRLTINGAIQWQNVEFPTGLNMIFSDARLPAAAVVLVEGKSNDGSSVKLWGHIEGKEVG